MEEGLERSVCVFVRALSNERVRADKCFGSISPSPPPPPPVNRAGLAALKAALLQRQVRRGGSSGPTAAHAVTNEEEYATESEKHTASQLSYLDALAEDNVQLRGVLDGIRATVHAAGRRLWQRTDDAPSHALVDNILQTAAFGADPIVGITAAECEALCAALDGAAASACQGIAFARATANPRDLALRQCILLKDIGGCSPASFAGAVFARRDTDSCSTPSAYDNPLCVQLARGRADLRVLDYAATEQSCRQGRGRPRGRVAQDGARGLLHDWLQQGARHHVLLVGLAARGRRDGVDGRRRPAARRAAGQQAVRARVHRVDRHARAHVRRAAPVQGAAGRRRHLRVGDGVS